MAKGKRHRFHGRRGRRRQDCGPYELDLVNIAVQLAHAEQRPLPYVVPAAHRPPPPPPRPPKAKPADFGASKRKPIHVEVPDSAAASTWRAPNAAWCASRMPESEVIFCVVDTVSGQRNRVGSASLAEVRARGLRRGRRSR